MDADGFRALVQGLLGGAPPRVWSLLVSVFGDLAQEDGAAIPGGALMRITDLAALKPEAVRVALHRLRKDRWIESRRVGRTSEYALTARGRAESTAASPRIYRDAPLAETAWLVVAETGSDHGVSLGPGIWMTSSKPDTARALAFVIDAERPLPEWISERICPLDLSEAGGALAHRLEDLNTSLADLDGLSVFEATTLRVLIVHEWRRFVLRLPALPDHVFPKSAAVPECRDRALGLLNALPRPRLDALVEA